MYSLANTHRTGTRINHISHNANLKFKRIKSQVLFEIELNTNNKNVSGKIPKYL
jgi:hypothetical protein